MTRNNNIMREMQNVEDTLQISLRRVDEIEQKLRYKLLTVQNRDELERELERVKEVLKKNEEQLHALRCQNTKSFMVAACLVFASFLLFGLYSLIF